MPVVDQMGRQRGRKSVEMRKKKVKKINEQLEFNSRLMRCFIARFTPHTLWNVLIEFVEQKPHIHTHTER